MSLPNMTEPQPVYSICALRRRKCVCECRMLSFGHSAHMAGLRRLAHQAVSPGGRSPHHRERQAEVGEADTEDFRFRRRQSCRAERFREHAEATRLWLHDSTVGVSVKRSARRNETETVSKLFRNCFETVSFQFHFVVQTV